MLKNCDVHVIEHIIQNNSFHNKELLLKYTVKYPQFSSEHYLDFLEKLNIYYQVRAKDYEIYLTTELFSMAIKEYKYSISKGFPIHGFEAFTEYNTTLNHECSISLYFDQYEYTGGAHGRTLRYSDSWDLLRSKPIRLREMFPYLNNYQEYIIQTIELQIANQIENGTNVYFENYKELVTKNFIEESFYLIPEGIVIYFQQYDIAPYSSGIPTFIIPYSKYIVFAPMCPKGIK